MQLQQLAGTPPQLGPRPEASASLRCSEALGGQLQMRRKQSSEFTRLINHTSVQAKYWIQALEQDRLMHILCG